MRIFPYTIDSDGKPVLNHFEPTFPCVMGRIVKRKAGKQAGENHNKWSAIRREIHVMEINRPHATIINSREDLDDFLRAAATKGDAQNIFVEPATQ